MQNTPDGGPAFPTGFQPDNCAPDSGMSLRDYFAAKALRSVTAGDHVDGVGDPDRHALLAYEYADAMLRARTAQSPADVQRAHLETWGKP